MKYDFDDGFMSGDRDPMDAPDQDFDLEQLYQALGEESTSNTERSEVVTRLLQLLIPADSKKLRPKAIGLRIIALAWVLNPALFADSPSARTLARRCGVNAPALARHTGEISRKTGLRNRAQRHAWNWKKG